MVYQEWETSVWDIRALEEMSEIQQTGLIEELVFEAQFLTEVYIIWFNKALYLDYIIETCFPQSK